jgi:hypothetical protein
VGARRQFAQTIEPHLGWTSDQGVQSSLGRNTAWRVTLCNQGGGIAIVRDVRYRVVEVGEDIERQQWESRSSAVDQLSRGLKTTDFSLANIGIGAGIGTGTDNAFEVMALSDAALRALDAVDVQIDFDSAAGDHFARTMSWIPRDRQKITVANRVRVKAGGSVGLLEAFMASFDELISYLRRAGELDIANELTTEKSQLTSMRSSIITELTNLNLTDVKSLVIDEIDGQGLTGSPYSAANRLLSELRTNCLTRAAQVLEDMD